MHAQSSFSQVVLDSVKLTINFNFQVHEVRFYIYKYLDNMGAIWNLYMHPTVWEWLGGGILFVNTLLSSS